MKDIDYVRVGKRLRKAREYLDLTQEQVAKILNLGRDAIIRIEKGTRRISAEELSAFSHLYKINMEEIIDSKSNNFNEVIFARSFGELSQKDQKEIWDLIKLKNEYKDKEER